MPSRYRYRSLFPERNSKKVPPYLAEMIRNEIMEKDLHVGKYFLSIFFPAFSFVIISLM